jgi:hypothetical protein
MLQATYVDDVFLFPHVTIQMVTEPMTKRVMAKKTTDGGFFCSWEGRVDYERQQDFSRVLFSSTTGSKIVSTPSVGYWYSTCQCTIPTL